jgi:endonuclease III
VEELRIAELSTEQIETLCSIAEDAARKYIVSKVSLKMIERLDISVEAEGEKPLNLIVEVDLVLSQQTKDVNLNKLVDEAAKKALRTGEDYLRKLK